MLNQVFKSVPLVLVLALLAGCGRVASTSAPSPGLTATEGGRREAPAARPSGPQTLAEAESRARTFLGTKRNANLATITVGPVTADGQFTNALQAGWVIGFWLPGKEQLSYQEVVLPGWRGEGVLRGAFGSAEAAPLPLQVGKLMPAEKAIAKALAAGLPEGEDYELDYLATPAGAVTKVTSRRSTRAIAWVKLDRNGQRVGTVEKPE